VNELQGLIVLNEEGVSNQLRLRRLVNEFVNESVAVEHALAIEDLV
jgi:hypothetical protein